MKRREPTRSRKLAPAAPKRRAGVSLTHVLSGDGDDHATLVVTCPHCLRSLLLDERAIAEGAPLGPLDLPRTVPAFSGAERSGQRHGRTALAARTPISTVMTREVVCVERDLSVEALTTLFLERGIHGAPVVDHGGELVGFVSMTDLLRRRYEDADADEAAPPGRPIGAGADELGGFHVTELAHATVGEVMMPLAISLEESAPLGLAAALMAFEGVHRVPVTSAAGKVVGILSSLDLLRWLAHEDGYEAPRPSGAPRVTERRPAPTIAEGGAP
jgi:CBS domain-containing protein